MREDTLCPHSCQLTRLGGCKQVAATTGAPLSSTGRRSAKKAAKSAKKQGKSKAQGVSTTPAAAALGKQFQMMVLEWIMVVGPCLLAVREEGVGVLLQHDLLDWLEVGQGGEVACSCLFVSHSSMHAISQLVS